MSRFRLYPSPMQEQQLLDACGHARYVWNIGLEQRSMWRRGRGPTPGFAEQCRQLTEARADNPWLAAGPVNIQQQALRDLDQAFRNWFNGTHGHPTWRRKDQHESVRLRGHDARTRKINRRWSAVWLPKVGWVQFRLSRPVPDFKSYRINRDRSGRWHVAFAAVPDPIPAPGTGTVVGVDRGVATAAALSDGTLTSPAGLRPKEAERLLRLQRKLARAQRGSNRRVKVKLQVARVKAREADRRKDWAEKTSTDLVRTFDVIRVENLNVRGMTASARGTVDKPGRNVRQKAGLNRGILKAGWTMLVTRLEQKAPGRVEKVRPAYTSQTCNVCKAVDPKSRESQTRFRCTSCGHQAHADVNAACNIAAGRAVTARGDRVESARSVKREPTAARPQRVA